MIKAAYSGINKDSNSFIGNQKLKERKKNDMKDKV